VSAAGHPSIALPEDLVYHSYGTGETLPLDAPIFRASGDHMQEYRIEAGFYCTGDSMAFTLSSDHFRQFLQMQAVRRIAPAFLQLFMPRGTVGEREEPSEKQKLVRRILARRDAIGVRTGTLPESYLLIREDRER
jgi:hypothetical protein